MLKKINKGIVAQKTEELEKKHKAKPHSHIDDKTVIANAFSMIPGLKNAQNIVATPVSSLKGVKVYNVQYSNGESGEPHRINVLVYPKLTYEVVDFLVTSAYNDSFKGLMHPLAPNAVVMKEYKY